MKLKEWYSARGSKFIYQRGSKLLDRYSLGTGKAMRRIERCVETLAECGCAPTLPAPGILVERYPDFIRRLQDEGAEIAVHGYQHVNLNDLPLQEARRQLERAARAFERLGIQAHGFRGPYISCCDELMESLPAGLFSYSSNKAIRWRTLNDEVARKESDIYNTLRKFYQAKDSTETVCMPWNCSNLVEIPVCLPDDMYILDGLQLGIEGLAQTWQQMLHETYQRGELFTLLFHTELADLSEPPLVDLLRAARAYQPPVWIARLYEISEWWKEKSTYKVDVFPNSDGLVLEFLCTPRATILAKGLGPFGSEGIWDSAYYQLPSNTIKLPGGLRPFVGIQDDAPEKVVSFLKEQGYILESGETARLCGIFLANELLSTLSSKVELVQTIESSPVPLVRYWRWPNGAKSVLAITGDLDALSLGDYVSRLFVK